MSLRLAAMCIMFPYSSVGRSSVHEVMWRLLEAEDKVHHLSRLPVG
jgi:hypothetical protein